MQSSFCLPVVYRWGIKFQAVSLKMSPPFLMLKPHCIPWSSLRPKAEHHLPRLGTKYMWNKNDRGGLPPTSGDLMCLSLNKRLQSHSWAVLFVVYRTKGILYWYAKRGCKATANGKCVWLHPFQKSHFSLKKAVKQYFGKVFMVKFNHGGKGREE